MGSGQSAHCCVAWAVRSMGTIVSHGQCRVVWHGHLHAMPCMLHGVHASWHGMGIAWHAWFMACLAQAAQMWHRTPWRAMRRHADIHCTSMAMAAPNRPAHACHP